MSFLPAEGYGHLRNYTKANIVADGLETKHLSKEVMRAAVDSLVFTRGLEQSKDAFGLGKGGTFTVPIFNNWGMPGTVQPLVSGTAISVGTQYTDSMSMMINEYGTGIGYETFGDWMTNIAVRKELVNTLSIHVGRMINWLHYDILVNSIFSIESPATGSYSNLLGTNRQKVGTGYGELGEGGVALAYDSLRNSLALPKQNGLYMWFAAPSTLRHLKAGSAFTNQQLWSGARGRGWQVLGVHQDILFIETTEQLNKGTSIVVGANAGGYGFGKLPVISYYNDYGQDAGRLQVWKVLFYAGQAAMWQTKGTTAIVVRTNTGNYNYGMLD